MDALGKRLVRALLTEQNFPLLNKYHVGVSDLFDDGRDAFEWVRNYFETKGEWPSVSMLQESTGITLPVETDSLDYIADQVRKRSLGKRLESKLTQAAEQLEARDPDAALHLIREAGTLQSVGELVSYRGAGPERIATYEKVKAAGGLLGIKTPWEKLDALIQGWVNGGLHVITGMQNVGKSWVLVINAEHCLKLGKRVLFVTMEMDSYRMERRLDSVRYRVPFEDLRDSCLDPFTEDRWKEALTKEVEGDGDILIADKKLVQRVSDVAAIVNQNKPDIVLIDGGYRFKGTGTSHWESTVDIVGDLQLAAEVTGIPWVVTTQQGDAKETGKEKKRGPKIHAWGVRYGKEWVINPDVSLGLYQNKDMRLRNELEIHVLKIREAGGSYREDVITINWDRVAMDFTEKVEDPTEEAGEAAKVEFD